MAVTNFTGDKNQGILEKYCSKEVFMELHGELIFLAVVNLFLSITALLGNTLILVALQRESSLSPQSKLLYRNLAITDFLVGIIVEPVCCLFGVHGEQKTRNLLLRSCDKFDCSLCTMFGVSVYLDYNKRGTTSSPVTGAQIQTHCHLQRNMYSCNRYLGFVRCRRINTILESFCNFSVGLYSFDSLWGHYNLLLFKNFFHSASLQSSWCSDGTLSRTPDSSNSTQRSSLQKGSVQCIVGAGNIVSLLSTNWYTTAYNPIKRDVFSGLRC